MAINSKQKGKRGELEWRDMLRQYGHEARRGQQFSGSPDSPDVVCETLPYHFEVKRTQKINVYEALSQAKKDCGNKIPIVAHKRNFEDWVVIMDGHDFMKLEKKVSGVRFFEEKVFIPPEVFEGWIDDAMKKKGDK